MQYFAYRLKQLRQEYNLSQKQLAQDLGYSRSAIANYEQLIRMPSEDILKTIAHYFNVSLDYLLGQSNMAPLNIELYIDPVTYKIIDSNVLFSSFYGYKEKDLLDLTIFDLDTLPEDQLKKYILMTIKKKHYFYYSTHKLTNGELRNVEIKTTAFKINNKHIVRFSIKTITNEINESLYEISEPFINILIGLFQHHRPYKQFHHHNVAELAYEIGKLLNLPMQRLHYLKIASLLHDIGELKIANNILNSHRKLTENEFNLVKEHTQYSYDMVKELPFEQPVAKIILQHHERLDGSGYPNRLTNKDILLEAKILAVADVVEAMTSNRPHRHALDIGFVLNEIKNSPKFDSEVIEVCLKLIINNLFVFKHA